MLLHFLQFRFAFGSGLDRNSGTFTQLVTGLQAPAKGDHLDVSYVAEPQAITHVTCVPNWLPPTYW